MMTWEIVVLIASTQLALLVAMALRRDTTTVRELKAEQAAMKADWSAKFAELVDAHARDSELMTRRLNAVTPGMNPLGSTYSTKPQRAG
jgi:hypothetical protein